MARGISRAECLERKTDIERLEVQTGSERSRQNSLRRRQSPQPDEEDNAVEGRQEVVRSIGCRLLECRSGAFDLVRAVDNHVWRDDE